jgi:peptidoglycan-associated lipoprotein
MQKRIGAIAVDALISACSSTPQKSADAEPSESPSGAAPATVELVAGPAETETQRLERIIKVLGSTSIYFDYDNDAVKPDYQGLLTQDYEALRSAPKLSIRLEGNADECGSREYNLALGQKRAEDVRRALGILGLPEARVEAVSYGKEKPRAACHEETCWAENRRVDVVAAMPDRSR